VRRRLIVAATIAVLAIPALPAQADPVGGCPPGWDMLEEGVDYSVFTGEVSNQPPWVSGQPVRIEQWKDRNGDGFVCRQVTNGILAIIDNNGPL